MGSVWISDIRREQFQREIPGGHLRGIWIHGLHWAPPGFQQDLHGILCLWDLSWLLSKAGKT